MSALEESWGAGALIRDAKGVPTWRYRVEPFQRVFRESLEAGLTVNEVEMRMGCQGGYVSRLLGLRPWPAGKTSPVTGKRYPSTVATSLSYDNAVCIARALDLDLVEWEL